jgi:hypothetical protein
MRNVSNVIFIFLVIIIIPISTHCINIKGYWINGALGAPLDDPFLIPSCGKIKLTMLAERNLSASVFTLDRDSEDNQFPSSSAKGIMIGMGGTSGSMRFTASFGLSMNKIEQRSGTFFDVSKDKTALGIPIDLELMLSLSKYIGVTASITGDVNNVHSYANTYFGISLGKLK